jgi:hypothetical protein
MVLRDSQTLKVAKAPYSPKAHVSLVVDFGRGKLNPHNNTQNRGLKT